MGVHAPPPGWKDVLAVCAKGIAISVLSLLGCILLATLIVMLASL
jgi:hypothetical protein